MEQSGWPAEILDRSSSSSIAIGRRRMTVYPADTPGGWMEGGVALSEPTFRRSSAVDNRQLHDPFGISFSALYFL